MSDVLASPQVNTFIESLFEQGFVDRDDESSAGRIIESLTDQDALDDVVTGNFEGALEKIAISFPSITQALAQKVDSGQSIPVHVMQDMTQSFFAVPEHENELDAMLRFSESGHSHDTQSQLVSALSLITNAKKQLAEDLPLFDNFPTDLDDELIELIERV